MDLICILFCGLKMLHKWDQCCLFNKRTLDIAKEKKNTQTKITSKLNRTWKKFDEP